MISLEGDQKMAEGKAKVQPGPPVLRVVDVLDHPHGGRIARVRLQGGAMPAVSDLDGATLRAVGPEGAERTLTVLGFSVTGGKVSDERLRSTGRVDLHVQEEGEGPSIDLTWTLEPA